jgi:hypothetical protein
MTNACIGYRSVVDACIVDEEVNIGEMCYIGFGESFLARDDDITVLGKGVNVPSHTVIRRNSRVLPHADMSSLGGDLIIPSSVLSRPDIAAKPWANEEVQRNERESVYVA